MPAYRGISQADLLSSIRAGIALLDKYSTGPECQKALDRLRQPNEAGQAPIDAIAAAQDDVSLARAVRASGVTGVFSELGDLLRYHHASDTDGAARQTVEDLYAWNAAGDAMLMSYRPIHLEMDSWLAAAYAGHIEFTPQNLAKIGDFLDRLTQERGSSPDAATMAKDAAAMIVELAALGKTDEIRQSFKLMDLHERHLVSLALMANSGLFDQPAAPAPSALGRFGILLGNTGDKINWQDAAVGQLREKMEEALGPFYDTDEVTMTGLGIITEDHAKVGVMFVGTRRAAEAVAKALPDQTIIDHKGETVAAPGQPPAPKKGGFKL